MPLSQVKKPEVSLERIGLGAKALIFRQELDELMNKHGARMIWGWQGKFVYVQVEFEDGKHLGQALTLARLGRGGFQKYMTSAEEIASERA